MAYAVRGAVVSGCRWVMGRSRRMSSLPKSVQDQVSKQYRIKSAPPSTSLEDIISANRDVLNKEIKFNAQAMNNLKAEYLHLKQAGEEITRRADKIGEILKTLGIASQI